MELMVSTSFLIILVPPLNGFILGDQTGIGKPVKAWAVLFHELGVHSGQIMASKKEFKNILKSIESRRDEQSPTGAAIRAAYAKVPKSTKKEHILEEVLAYMVENNPEVTIVRRVTAILYQLQSTTSPNG